MEPIYENVNHPNHYSANGIEVQQIIEAFELGWNLGNVCKYICRAGKKPKASRKEDLQKAMQYLRFELDSME